MYNYSFTTTYLDLSDNLQDDQYRRDLLSAFSLQSYTHEPIMKEIYLLFDKLKHNIQFTILIDTYIINQKQFPLQIDKKTAFMILFSFEYFYYMHKCLGYLLNNKPINEEYFQTFVSLIQKK